MHKRLTTACLLAALAGPTNAQPARTATRAGLDQTGIAAFNSAFTDAIRAMNNDAVLALWEDDGIAILPGSPPVRGKAAMRAMLQGISSAHPKAKMESFTNQCFDIEGRGSWASERCVEHQVVTEPGKPTFDSWGNMLLVLHRQPSGEWRLSREMWNQGAPPQRH
jgi:ketosteroid isomerase-like protein